MRIRLRQGYGVTSCGVRIQRRETAGRDAKKQAAPGGACGVIGLSTDDTSDGAGEKGEERQGHDHCKGDVRDKGIVTVKVAGKVRELEVESGTLAGGRWWLMGRAACQAGSAGVRSRQKASLGEVNGHGGENRLVLAKGIFTVKVPL